MMTKKQTTKTNQQTFKKNKTKDMQEKKIYSSICRFDDDLKHI